MKKQTINRRKLIADIIEWMYINDGNFNSKSEWRASFIMHLKGMLYSSPTKVKPEENIDYPF